MIWFFGRGQERLTVETIRDPRDGTFTLTIQYPDGSEHTEHFDTESAFKEHVEELELQLQAERWTDNGAALRQPALLKRTN